MKTRTYGVRLCGTLWAMTLVAFGVTGDLMRLKILPALAALHDKGALPASMRIIGLSRRPWSDEELREHVQDVLPEAPEAFLSRFTFLQGDATEPTTFTTLARALEGDDALIYLSLAPTLYRNVFAHMQQTGFAEREGRTAVMVEKPFGTSGADAEELYAQLQKVVAQQNIYLVDHYLAKDWIRSLGELSVPREDIAQIHLYLWENLGVEKRGALYDQLGALRDVGQNHLLQALAHLLARAPTPLARAEALEQLPLLDPALSVSHALRAQYAGYRDTEGVGPASETETYFRVHTILRLPGWEGVKVVLEAGKRLPRSRKEAELTLKDGRTITLAERPNAIDEYETLLSAALMGDQSLFVSMREVRAQWRFADAILAAWATGTPKLISYPPGTLPSPDSA